MLHGIRIRLVAATAVLFTAPSLIAQGLYWESTSTGGPPVPGAAGPKTEKSYAVPKKFKNESGDKAMIVRLDQEKVYMVDTKAKTYSEMTFADMESAMKAMNAQMEAMKKQLENMPPEQRAALEKQLSSNPAFKAAKEPKVEVTKTDEKREIAGRSSVKYVIKEDGQETFTTWTTDLKEFEPIRADFTQLMKRTAAMNPAMGKGVGQAYEKIEGFPLETDMKGMMKMKNTVTKIEPRSIPDAEFEVPAGFTKTRSPLDSLPRGPGPKAEPRLKELKERE